jgi:hypothetical protein
MFGTMLSVALFRSLPTVRTSLSIEEVVRGGLRIGVSAIAKAAEVCGRGGNVVSRLAL